MKTTSYKEHRKKYQILKVSSHQYWIYKNGEALGITWTSLEAAKRYISDQTRSV